MSILAPFVLGIVFLRVWQMAIELYRLQMRVES